MISKHPLLIGRILESAHRRERRRRLRRRRWERLTACLRPWRRCEHTACVSPTETITSNLKS